MLSISLSTLALSAVKIVMLIPLTIPARLSVQHLILPEISMPVFLTQAAVKLIRISHLYYPGTQSTDREVLLLPLITMARLLDILAKFWVVLLPIFLIPQGAGTKLGTYIIAEAINDNGWIVGFSHVSRQAYRIRPSPITGLGTLGGSQSYAYAINNNGKIVGEAYITLSLRRACLFDSTGGGENIDLGTIDGYAVSQAYSINNMDQIVGGAHNNISDSYSAVLFDSTGGGANINLGAFDGYYNQSAARSINDRGQIVGSAFGWSPFLSDSHAVLFDPTGHGDNIDLNTLVEPSSWTLNIAYGINNDVWIVGSMYNYSNLETHAFLLTPEPATVLLFALGSITILRKRNHRLQRLH